MKKIYFLLFFVMNSVCSVVIRCKGTHSIHLIHYNDFHARFEETSDDSLICNHVNETCFGGLPRMVYEIEAIRRQHPDALLLDAGDSFQGTYWYTAMKWNVTQYFINLLNHDAHAIGNHEFDDDIEGLVPYLTHLKAPALAANMDCTEEPILKELYKPYVIVERKGRKIGIIGVTTTVTKGLAPTGNVKFTDPREAAFHVSKHLNEMGVDIIILLSHCGYPMDIEIAKDYGQYIDVIVGGHSHRDRRQIFPYLTAVKSSDTHEVLVLQADAFTKYLGSISMDFDCEGNVIRWSGGPIELDSSIPEDEKMKEELAPYAEIVHNASKEVIGYLDKAMHHSDCVHGECSMGNFLTDAIKYIAQHRLNCSRPFVGIIQRSNMRANLPKGDITQGSVVELFPYLDFLESFELRGKYIYEALERSASDLMEGKTFTGPWLLQVSGLQVIYNITKPEGHRVEAVFVTDSSNSTKVPLDPDEVYQVVSPIYLSNGGDGYEVLNENKKNPQVIGYDQHALREYIQAHKSFYVNIEGRIIIVR